MCVPPQLELHFIHLACNCICTRWFWSKFTRTGIYGKADVWFKCVQYIYAIRVQCILLHGSRNIRILCIYFKRDKYYEFIILHGCRKEIIPRTMSLVMCFALVWLNIKTRQRVTTTATTTTTMATTRPQVTATKLMLLYGCCVWHLLRRSIY